MFNNLKNNKSQEYKLYNKIVSLSRNKFFYTKLGLKDTFQNRIILIFMHISFLLIKTKENKKYKNFHQKIFDLTFKHIEFDMREIGYGDATVNKNMKFLVKNFYNILLECKNYNKKNINSKVLFLSKNLQLSHKEKSLYNEGLIDYFNKYEAFCFDLSPDSVLKGDLNFNYK